MSWGAIDAEGNIVRDPTFPDIPSFAEVCEATPACETSGPGWDAWVAFFIAGFPAQKMVFLPGNAAPEVVEAYATAFDAIIARPDFAEMAASDLGAYPQMTRAAAAEAFRLGTQVSPEAREFVVNWLQDSYGVSLE